MPRSTPLAQFKATLRGRASAARKATTIVLLAPRLPAAALPIMDDYLGRVDPLVQVAIMDAYFEMTGDDFHEEDLIAIMDRAARLKDAGEELYMAARVALGRVRGDDFDAWQAPTIEVAGIRAVRRVGVAARRPAPRESITIVIHGTWAADGTWWRPRGDFFEYVKTGLERSDMYSGTDLFSWSGKNSDGKRRQAGESLSKWLKSHPAAEVNVFAHSHGANVAMLATRRDAVIRRLVMLSPPVRRDYFPDWTRVQEAFNIQACFDPVVAIARGGKWFGEHGLRNVAEIELRANGHSASHTPEVWRKEGLPAFVGAPWL